MSQTINRLRLDHKRMGSVLQVLQEQCALLRNNPVAGNADHLFCLVDYLAEYPDAVHHPAEDLVFASLLEHSLSAEQEASVAANCAAHGTLKQATIDLMDLLETPSGEIDTEQFLPAVDAYLTMQFDHMRFEEQVLFPLALDTLSEAEWERLDALYGEQTDPLIERADQRFAALYRLLGADPNEEVTTVALDSVARFLNATK